MKTVKAFITGVVQGVFFRKFLKEEAEKLDLNGFVRNLSDGRVEIVIEGEDGKVNEMLKICKKGNKHSDIKEVRVENLSHQGFDSFKVLTS